MKRAAFLDDIYINKSSYLSIKYPASQPGSCSSQILIDLFKAHKTAALNVFNEIGFDSLKGKLSLLNSLSTEIDGKNDRLLCKVY